MALIKCQECNKEISDKASQCIHCGCPIEKDLIDVTIINECYNCNGYVSIYVDDKFITRIDLSDKNGKWFLKLSPGWHDFQLVNENNNEKTKLYILEKEKVPKGEKLTINNYNQIMNGYGWININKRTID